MTARDALGVVVGAIVGATARWTLAEAVDADAALLLVNIVGCLVIGWALATHRGAWLTAGLCGALTSFSALALQVAVLLDQSSYGSAGAWLLATIVGCGLAFLLGRRVAAGHAS